MTRRPARRRAPSVEHWLPLIVAATLSVNVTIGVVVMGASTLLDRPVSDQFDRLITLLAGALIGFLIKSGIDKVTVANTTANPVPTTDEAGHVDATLAVLVFMAVCIGAITWHYLHLHP